MNQDQLDAFGKEDRLAQLTWLLQRDKELRKLWKCPCGAALPVKGDIWKERWDAFRDALRCEEDPPYGIIRCSVYYCHVCVGKREIGIDHEIHS